MVWGLQSESGSFPTSYIKTSGSSVTRSADIASISGDNFGTYRRNVIPSKYSNSGSIYNGENQNVTYQENSALGFDGKTFSARKLIKIGSGSGNLIRYSPTGHPFNFGGSGNKIWTSYWKIGSPDVTKLEFRLNLVSIGDRYFNINLTTNSSNSQNNYQWSSTLQDNGWWKVIIAFNVPSNGNNVSVKPQKSNGTMLQGEFIYVDGESIQDADSMSTSSATNHIENLPTFTSRLGNATYVDSNGLIKTAYRNHVGFSEDFSSWNVNQGAISSQRFTAPDGTETAFKLVPNAVTSNLSFVFEEVTNIAGTSSVYVKSDEFSHVNLVSWKNNSATIKGVSFDLTNRTIHDSHNATGEIIDAGNGWSKIILRHTDSSYAPQFFLIQPHNGQTPNKSDLFRSTVTYNGTDGLLIWHPMKTDSLTDAGEYAPTTSLTKTGAPRYSHDPETLVPTGLYLEPAATNHQMVMPTNTYAGVTQNGVANVTNYVLPSDYDYYGTSSVLYSQDVTAPDGTDTTLKVAFSGLQNNVNHNYLKIGNATGTLNAGTYTFSFFIKSDNANVRDYMGPNYDGRAGGIAHQTAQANPWVSGQNTAANWKLIDYPNGWIRAYVNFTLSSTITNIWNSGIYWLLAGGNTQTDLNYKNFYLWGFQLEAGIYPSSFIGSSVASAVTTRVADTYTSTAKTVFDRKSGNQEAIIGINGVASGYNKHVTLHRGNEIMFAVKHTTNANALNWFYGYDSRIIVSTKRDTTGHHSAHAATIGPNIITKSAFNINETAINHSVNGGSIATTTYTSNPSTFDLTNGVQLFQNYSANSNKFQGTIDRITLWNKVIPNQSLINLST